MAVEIEETGEGNVLKVTVSGRLHRQDYDRLVPRMEDLIGRYGKVRIVMEMEDFHGWSLGALWDDIKFDLHHYRDIERLAMVGSKRWQKGMATVCKPFTKAKVRYFEHGQEEQALQWVRAA